MALDGMYPTRHNFLMINAYCNLLHFSGGKAWWFNMPNSQRPKTACSFWI